MASMASPFASASLTLTPPSSHALFLRGSQPNLRLGSDLQTGSQPNPCFSSVLQNGSQPKPCFSRALQTGSKSNPCFSTVSQNGSQPKRCFPRDLHNGSLSDPCFSMVLGSWTKLCLGRDLQSGSRSGALRRFSCRPSSASQATEHELALPEKLQEIVRVFQGVTEPRAKCEQLLQYAAKLKPLAEDQKQPENKVEGCVSKVYIVCEFNEEDGRVYFEAESDVLLTKGLAGLLVEGLSGVTVEEVLKVTPEFVHMLAHPEEDLASFLELNPNSRRRCYCAHHAIGGCSQFLILPWRIIILKWETQLCK
jgi:cysteine desulfuration protein SufE